MAVGDLTPDQADYVDKVAQGTGLDKTVVISWLGAESHWGVTKPDHNYLNIGPGHSYASADQAAAAVSSAINSSSYYSGIRAAIPLGPVAQISAIKTSPWDAGHYASGAFDAIFGQLSGGKSTRTVTDPMSPSATPVIDPLTGLTPGSGAVGGAIGGLAGQLFQSMVGSELGKQILGTGLTIVFVAAGLGLAALGLSRLTQKSPRDHFESLQGLFGTTKQAAELAALA